MRTSFAVIVKQLTQRTSYFYFMQTHPVYFFPKVRPELKCSEIDSTQFFRFWLTYFAVAFLTIVVANFVWKHHHCIGQEQFSIQRKGGFSRLPRRFERKVFFVRLLSFEVGQLRGLHLQDEVFLWKKILWTTDGLLMLTIKLLEPIKLCVFLRFNLRAKHLKLLPYQHVFRLFISQVF